MHLPGFCLLPGQMPFHLPLELLLRQFLCFVQPGCTIEVLSVPASHLGQLGRLASSRPALGRACGSVAAAAREWPSGSRPSAGIPGISSPGTHQRTSGCPAASIVRPEPRRDIGPTPQTVRLAPAPVVFSQDKISSILSQNEQSPPAIELRCHRAEHPLVLKLVKPIKVARSWTANQFRFHQLLVAQTKSQMRAAHTAVLREADSAVGREVAGFDLADGGLNQLAELPPLLFSNRCLQILNSRVALFRTKTTRATSEIPLIQE